MAIALSETLKNSYEPLPVEERQRRVEALAASLVPGGFARVVHSEYVRDGGRNPIGLRQTVYDVHLPSRLDISGRPILYDDGHQVVLQVAAYTFSTDGHGQLRGAGEGRLVLKGSGKEATLDFPATDFGRTLEDLFLPGEEVVGAGPALQITPGELSGQVVRPTFIRNPHYHYAGLD